MPAGESDEGLRTWFAVSGMRFEMRQLLAGPLFHGAPHSAAFNGLYCGNTLIMPAKLDAETIVRLIKKYRIEYVQMVPTLMQRISRMPGFRKEDLASLEVLCHTGGVCSQDLKREWLQIIPPERLYEIVRHDRVHRHGVHPRRRVAAPPRQRRQDALRPGVHPR
ncbi:MAG: AMP-binding protein [Oscillospiraceae bacterium]